MTTQKTILQLIKKHGQIRSIDVAKQLRVSRQTATAHLRAMVASGALVKSGSTKTAVYHLSSNTSRKPQSPEVSLLRKLRGLHEDKVYGEVALRMALNKKLSPNVRNIANYAFSEMMNNAIDHSMSEKADIIACFVDGKWTFDIRDFGIGIFKRVQSTYKLASEAEAAEHVLKGKQTSMPSRHSGEGIFFTSRIADQFVIESHKLKLNVDNQKNDLFLGEIPFLKGTRVHFEIKCRSRKKLSDLFERFSDENLEFNKNEVRLKLRRDEQDLISRSQARRLLAGLERFKHIAIDFDGVPGIGQAFADEIFRVYAQQNPTKRITYANANPTVEFMLQRSIKSKRSS